jgi:hypothetical protein
MTCGEIVEVFEALAAKEHPFFPYPIVHVKPSRSGASPA